MKHVDALERLWLCWVREEKRKKKEGEKRKKKKKKKRTVFDADQKRVFCLFVGTVEEFLPTGCD